MSGLPSAARGIAVVARAADAGDAAGRCCASMASTEPTSPIAARMATCWRISPELYGLQMPEFVGIPNHVDGRHEAVFDLERVGLHQASWTAHDQARQAVDGLEARRKVVRPALAYHTGQERGHVIGAL